MYGVVEMRLGNESADPPEETSVYAENKTGHQSEKHH